MVFMSLLLRRSRDLAAQLLLLLLLGPSTKRQALPRRRQSPLVMRPASIALPLGCGRPPARLGLQRRRRRQSHLTLLRDLVCTSGRLFRRLLLLQLRTGQLDARTGLGDVLGRRTSWASIWSRGVVVVVAAVILFRVMGVAAPFTARLGSPADGIVKVAAAGLRAAVPAPEPEPEPEPDRDGLGGTIVGLRMYERRGHRPENGCLSRRTELGGSGGVDYGNEMLAKLSHRFRIARPASKEWLSGRRISNL